MPGIQGELGHPVADEVQVRHLLDVLAEELEEPGVIHGMVVVMPGVDVQALLRHGPGRHVQHVGQPLSDCRIEGLVHVGDTLATGEIRGPETYHAHPCRHRGGGMLTLRLEEEEPPAIGVGVSRRHGQSPTLTHLGGRCDWVGSRRFAGVGFTPDDGFAAVHGFGDSRVFKGLLSLVALRAGHPASLPASSRMEANWAPSTHTMAPVGQRAVASGLAVSIFA